MPCDFMVYGEQSTFDDVHYKTNSDMEFLTSLLNGQEETNEECDGGVMGFMTSENVLGAQVPEYSPAPIDGSDQSGFISESYSSDASSCSGYSPHQTFNNCDFSCTNFSENGEALDEQYYQQNHGLHGKQTDQFNKYGHPYFRSVDRDSLLPNGNRRSASHVCQRKVPEVVRIGATVRERTRMHMLNNAFDELRQAVPKTNMSDHQKLSKISTLRQAIQYIGAMVSTLNSSGVEIQKVRDSSVGDRRGKRRSNRIKKCTDNR